MRLRLILRLPFDIVIVFKKPLDYIPRDVESIWGIPDGELVPEGDPALENAIEVPME